MTLPALALLLVRTGLAQPLERTDPGIRGLAGEDGPHTFWTNPALLGFDRDPTLAGYYARGLGADTQDLAFVAAGGGLATSLAHRSLGETSWWTASGGVTLRPDDDVSVGVTANRQVPDFGEAFTTWDVGLGVRPTSWLAVGGVARNVGSTRASIPRTWGAGAAWRPRGDLVTAGIDWVATGTERLDIGTLHRLEASARVHAARGTWVRGWASQGLNGDGGTAGGLTVELRAFDVAWAATAQAGGSAKAGGWVATTLGDDQLARPTNHVARFEVDGDMVYVPVPGLFSDAGEGWLEYLGRLRATADDPTIRGVILDLRSAPGSLAHVQELRGAIERVRAASKPVVAYLGQDTGNAAYLLAAACDKVFLHPAGGVDLVGLEAEIQYLRGAMEKVGVGAQYAKRGKYKSAPETFTETRSTDGSREQTEALLDDLYAQLVDGIARGRNKPEAEVKALVDGGPYTGREAVEKGLVDALVYPDELEAKSRALFTGDVETVDDYGVDRDTSGWAPERAVAVVVVDGVIDGGPSSPGGFLSGAATGSDTIVELLDSARENDVVKAVVLRVDSPGGSAFASDEIWRAVARVKEAGKPVVVSMGAYAASGGYYVSAGADAIYALPGTVTGSIGIYGGKFNVGGLLDRMDVTTESWTRGRNAGMYSMARPFDEVEYAALDRLIADGYRQFKEKVEKGRNMSPERVEALAQGRVWSGAAAKERGLVDAHGGFFEALDAAKAKAGIAPGEPVDVLLLDPWLSGLDGVVARTVRAVAPQTPTALQPWLDAARVGDERTWAMLPWRLTVR
jgi:protease-4